MGYMSKVTSVAANTTTANLLAGDKDEFVEEASVVTLAAFGSAVGLKATLIVGSEVVVDDQELAVGTTLPKMPEDVMAQGGAFPQDRITLRLRNTTGGAITGYVKVVVEPA